MSKQSRINVRVESETRETLEGLLADAALYNLGQVKCLSDVARVCLGVGAKALQRRKIKTKEPDGE